MLEASTKVTIVDLRGAAGGGLFSLLPKGRREELMRLRPADALRSLYAELAVRAALAEEGIPPEKLRFVRGEHGKPLLEGGEMHFNLSHAGDVAVCAVSSSPVGVDAEKVVPRGYGAIVRRLFTAEEGARVHTLTNFYALWTAKESAVKYLGLGIGALRRTELCGEAVRLDGELLPCRVVTRFEGEGRYAVSVCAQGEALFSCVRAEELAARCRILFGEDGGQ